MILLLFGLIQNVISQGISLALSDLQLTQVVPVTGWSATASDGNIQSEYNTKSSQCNNYIFTLNRNFQKYSKTYTITHYEFYQLFIEFEVYFYQFTDSTISISVNTQLIYKQTFTSQKLKLNNNCGIGQESQYIIYQGFYTKSQTLQVQIEYIQNVLNAQSIVGIKNLNIYSNGIPLVDGCPMNKPFNLNGVCLANCPSTQYYLGGPNLNQCLGPQNGNKLIKQILTTDNWIQADKFGTVITNNGLYPNIMNNQKFSSQFASNGYFMSITFTRTNNYKLQLQFIFYIFGEWDDQSYITIAVGNGGTHPLLIAKYYGVYQSSTLSGIYFTNLTTSTGQNIVARKTLITLSLNYYQQTLQFTFKQSIIGSGSFGISDMNFYDAATIIKLTTIFDLTCPIGFYQYRGMCKSNNCPAFSVTSETNRNCTDYSSTESKIFNPNQSVDLIGYYLIMLLFNQNQFEQTDIVNIFTVLPPFLNNYYNGQHFSFIQGLKVLGGQNSWGYGAYGKTFSNLQQHIQLRIYFTLYLIDNFQIGDQFEIYIDGILVLTQGQITQTYLDGFIKYYSTDIEYKQPHYQSKLHIMFLCNIAQKDSSKASCGIQRLFVLIDQDVTQICPQNVVPFNYLTTSCEHTPSYLQCLPNNICSLCSSLAGYVFSSGSCDCNAGFFYKQSSGICIKCHYTCATCNEAAQTNCLTCDKSRTLLQSNNPNPQSCTCNENYFDFQPQMACQQITSDCHYSCLTCFGIQYYQCLSCQANSLRTLNYSNQCLCNSGYLDIGVSQCGCDSSCLTCYGMGNQSCLSCDVVKNRYLDQGSCLCSTGFNDLLSPGQSCVANYIQCHYSCLACYGLLNSNCLSCQSINNRTLLLNQCLCNYGYFDINAPACVTFVCNDGYYQEDNNCFLCDRNCLTCFGPLDTQCQSCSIQNQKYLSDLGSCECIRGYQENNKKQCVDCSSNLRKSIVECQYADPIDGVWTYGEQCDDGNTTPRDGCTKFKIQFGYSCLNEFNQQSICYKCQDNCVDCDLVNKEIICITCQESFHNNKKQCIQCMDPQCKQCNLPFQCELCFNNITPRDGRCIYCEQGYYQIDNICQPKCGDGIKIINEECDDGNNYTGDGCFSNCQLEDNYVCNTISNQSNCIIASPPILEINSVPIIQHDMRRFTILSSQSVYYSNISLQIISNQSQFIKLQYLYHQNQKNITLLLQIDVNLTFLQSFDYLEIQFVIYGQITNEYQQEVSDRQLLVQVKNIIILQQSEKQISSQISKVSQGSVSALAINSVTQLLLLGSIQQFILLLNILQQLNYIQYVNIQFPPNFTDFFLILSGFNIDSLLQFVNLYQITTNLNLITYAKPPLKLQYYGINAYFLANIQQFITQCLLGIFVYQALKLLIVLLVLVQISFQINVWFNRHFNKKIKKILNKLVRLCNYIRQNGFIQLILTNCYNIQFAIQLQLSVQDEDFKQTLNKLLALGCLLFYGYIIIKLNHKQDEELNFQHIWQNKLNQIQMIQAFIFMFSIVNLQDNPEFQVMIISLSSLIIIIYTWHFSPFKNFFNNYKLIIQELCMFMANISFILYIYSPIIINPINLGWFQLGLYCLMIIGIILIEAYLNAIRILKYYQQSKKLQQIVQTIKKNRVFTK